MKVSAEMGFEPSICVRLKLILWLLFKKRIILHLKSVEIVFNNKK